MATYRKSRPGYPDGVLGIYDNGGKTFDRYTVVYTPVEENDGTQTWPILGMSTNPFAPGGFGQHEEFGHRITRWPGNRVIDFEDLPEDCQRAVRQDLEAMAQARAIACTEYGNADSVPIDA